jgi:hypothetical protein
MHQLSIRSEREWFARPCPWEPGSIWPVVTAVMALSGVIAQPPADGENAAPKVNRGRGRPPKPRPEGASLLPPNLLGASLINNVYRPLSSEMKYRVRVNARSYLCDPYEHL